MPTDTGPWPICSDVVMVPEAGGMLATNVRARRHVWLGKGLVDLILCGSTSEALAASDRSTFSNAAGLLADPTRLDRADDSPRVTFADAAEALAFLERHFIVVTDDAAYEDYFAPLRSPLDAAHFGTFHQQLGQEFRFRRRIDPDAWWYSQKFDPATGTVGETLYKYVQQRFLEDFFSKLDVTGKTVLDFGCGSGMASRRFAEMGARVIGLDPSRDLLDKAQAAVGANFTPAVMDLNADDPLAALPDRPIDMVWMADVLMFYFHTMDNRPPRLPPEELLRRLGQRMPPGGRLTIMQPHGTFWLAPWMGSARRPFTVLTEYAHRLYSVTPTLGAVSEALHEAGFAIARIHEPLAEAGPPDDERAGAFAAEFPVWWVFDCVKL